MFISLLYHIPSKIEKKTKNCKEFNAWFYYHLLCFFSIQIKEEVFLETSLRWVRRLGEIIQWMISAILEVPWLSFGPKVPKLPSARNNLVSSTFLTAESFRSTWMTPKIKVIIWNIASYFMLKMVCLHSKRNTKCVPFILLSYNLLFWGSWYDRNNRPVLQSFFSHHWLYLRLQHLSLGRWS